MEWKPNPRMGGFTLIELMIVVAIIGVLAGVALPSYQTFVIKAKITDAIAATHQLKLALADYAISNGGTSGLAGLHWSSALKELGVPNNFFGDDSAYVKNAWWSHSAGEIRVSIANIEQLDGRRLVLRAIDPDFPTSWRCISDDSDSSLIPSEYLPSHCQSSGTE